MAAVKFVNAMGNDEVLNLDRVTAVEKPKSPKSLMIAFGKEHTHINLRSEEERDELFERICRAYKCEELVS